MLYTLSLIIVIFNFINIFIKRNSKGLLVSTFLLYWVLIFGNNNNPDYLIYQRLYQFQSSKDAGYNLLAKIFNSVNISYNVFLAIVSFVCLLLIFSTVLRYTNNYSYIFLLYFAYPLMLDAIQIRNFIVMSIFIFAIRYLEEYSIKNILKYIFLICIASSFQITGLIYLPIVFFVKMDNSKIKKTIFYILIIIGGIFSVFRKSLLNYFGLFVTHFIGEERGSTFFEVKTNFGFLLPWFIQIMIIGIVIYSANYIVNNKKNEISKLEFQFIKILKSISLYSILFFPFYMFNMEFVRFSRNIFILYYIYITVFNKYIIPKSYIKIIINTLFISIVIFYFNFDILHNGGNGIDFIFKAIFENNYLINKGNFN